MRASLFAVMVVLGACAAASDGAVQTQLPQHIREDLAQREAALREPGIVAAGLNQRADLGGGLIVRPREVLEDSRCPQNARCVQAGRLRLRVGVEGVGEREITLGEAGVETPRGNFALVAVLPGPWTDWPDGAKPAHRFGLQRR
jgi:hypothetical protein